MINIGDWVRPKGNALPGRGCIIGRVVALATYSRLEIPAFFVDGSYGENPPQLCPADALEYWFTPQEEA